MRGKKLSTDKIAIIEVMVEENCTDREIANQVECSPLTVKKYREIKENSTTL